MKTYRLIKEENNVRNRNYIRIKEGIKKINRKKILILIPIMYFLIIGCLTYAGEWLLGKMGSPFSTELYLVIFYALMIVLLSAGMIDKDQKAIINQIEANFSTIARLGRAFGIHLIFATQRPDADILKGQIKNNIGYRICGRADKVLSQIILDNSEASDKISPNDQGMFLMNTGVLFKAYYVEDDCLEGVDINGETAG